MDEPAGKSGVLCNRYAENAAFSAQVLAFNRNAGKLRRQAEGKGVADEALTCVCIRSVNTVQLDTNLLGKRVIFARLNPVNPSAVRSFAQLAVLGNVCQDNLAGFLNSFFVLT